MSNFSNTIPDSQATPRTDGRRIPLGLRFLLDTTSHNGVFPLGLGLILLAFPFTFQNELFSPAMVIPFLWSDAGVATVTKINRGMDGGKPGEGIQFTYKNPQGNEYQHYCLTERKTNFFVVGNQYPILKFRDNWQLTTLADLDWWERIPFFLAWLSMFTSSGCLIAIGISWYIVGYYSSSWKRELLRFGNYAVGTFSHYETAPIYWRILGLKKKMFRFSTESVSDGENTVYYASDIQPDLKKESPPVEVFYDPLNPTRAFILESNSELKHVRYSPETDTFHTARWVVVFPWLMYFLWFSVLLYLFYCIVVVRL